MINGHEVTYVQGIGVDNIWDEIVPFVEQMTKVDSDVSPKVVLNKLKHEGALGWIVRDQENRIVGLLVTEVVVLNTGKYLEVQFTSGSGFKMWMGQMNRMLELYVDQEGLKGIRAQCRPGMAKWLRMLGWTSVHELMEWKS